MFREPRKIQRRFQMCEDDMAVLEWLRPLVNNKPWDYCVIWKLGDDPSRFIEWGACCCGGGNRADGFKIKDEKDIETCLVDECKDEGIKHLIRTKACTKLAQLPSIIPLYSGIHGDVVISKQPRWTLCISDDEPNGTQVLIPVAGGLIEFFSMEHEVPRDQNFIDYISAFFEITPKQDMNPQKMNADLNLEEQLPDPPRSKDYLENWPLPLHYLNINLPKIPQPRNYSSFEGSSTCSSLSNDHQFLKISPPDHVFCSISPEKSSKEYVDSPSSNLRLLKRNKCTSDGGFMFGKANVGAKIRQKGEKGIYKSKNLMTERNRRKRIKDGMFALRSIVPKISKMDRASTLGDAAEFIKELHGTIDNYHEELREMEENDRKRVNAKLDQTKLTKKAEKPPVEVQVEVSQLGEKEFLLKVVCKQTRGGFSRLVEAFDSLGLQVTDANVTTLNGSVLNVLKVQANRTEVEAKALKSSLIQMVR